MNHKLHLIMYIQIKGNFDSNTYLGLYTGFTAGLLMIYSLLRSDKIFLNQFIKILLISFIMVTTIEALYFWKPQENDHFGGQGKKYFKFISKSVNEEPLDYICEDVIENPNKSPKRKK